MKFKVRKIASVIIQVFYSRRWRGCPYVVQWQRSGLLVNMSSNRSCTRGMSHIQNSSHQPRLPRPSIVLHAEFCNNAQKHDSCHSILFTTACNFLDVYITQACITCNEINPKRGFRTFVGYEITGQSEKHQLCSTSVCMSGTVLGLSLMISKTCQMQME